MKKLLIALILILLTAGCSIPGISKRNVIVSDQKTQEKITCDLKSDIQDCDNDGLDNAQEKTLGTDPQKADSDGDSYLDGDEVKKGYNPLGIGAVKQNKENLNFAYISTADDKTRIILNGKAIGEVGAKTRTDGAIDYLQLNNDKIIFGKLVDNGYLKKFYNGKELPDGAVFADGHYAYFKQIDNKSHLIYDDKDIYTYNNITDIEGTTQTPHGLVISGNNYAFMIDVYLGTPFSNDNKVFHVIYNGKDLGYGRDPVLSGDNIAYGKQEYWLNEADGSSKKLYDGGIVYNGKIMGTSEYEGSSDTNLQLSGNNIAFRDWDAQKEKSRLLYNGESLCDWGDWTECPFFLLFPEGIAWYKRLNSNDRQFYLFFNGKNYGKKDDLDDFLVSGKNIAFERINENNKYDIIYNGKNLGEGTNFTILGDNIAFVRTINGENHVIYNGKDLGPGFNPVFSYSN